DGLWSRQTSLGKCYRPKLPSLSAQPPTSLISFAVAVQATAYEPRFTPARRTVPIAAAYLSRGAVAGSDGRDVRWREARDASLFSGHPRKVPDLTDAPALWAARVRNGSGMLRRARLQRSRPVLPRHRALRGRVRPAQQ